MAETSKAQMLPAPLGPSSATELTVDGRILCFEEKSNKIIAIDVSTQNRTQYPVNAEFGFENYFWSQIISYPDNIVLVLLKHHATKMFWLITFELCEEPKAARAMFKLKTRIRSVGYHVASQKNEKDCFFSFCNFGKRFESVILQASSRDHGRINAQILSLGKNRFCMELRKPCVKLDKKKRHSSLTGLQTHYMTELPAKTFAQPFYYDQNAIFLDKAKPKEAIVLKVVLEAKYGLRAAISARLSIDGKDETDFETEQRILEADAVFKFPPNGTSTWSNACVINHSVYFFIQDKEAAEGSLWSLNLKTYEWKRMDLKVAPEHHPLRSNLILRMDPDTKRACLRGNCEKDAAECNHRHHILFLEGLDML